MSSSVVRRQKLRKSPPQPSDRHLAEIGEFDGSTYINAGIDSTWYVIINSLSLLYSLWYLISCKKRGRTIHKLTNGIMVSAPQTQRTMNNRSGDDLSSELSNDSSNDDQTDSIPNRNCSHCGKWSNSNKIKTFALTVKLIRKKKTNTNLVLLLFVYCIAICFVFFKSSCSFFNVYNPTQ